MAKVGFVSEAGSHGFKYESPASTHFSVTVVLVEEENRREVEEGLLQIWHKFFPEGKLNIHQGAIEPEKLREILAELKTLKFSFHSLLIDKRKLHQESPLQYKGTFYKFLSGLIYNNLYRTVRNLAIIANEMGSSEFMQSFRRYIQENHQVDLFSPASFTFSTGEEAIILQLAHLLGWSLNEYNAGLLAVNVQKELYAHCVGVESWPGQHVPYTVDIEEAVDYYDQAITEAAQLRARNYIMKHTGSKDPVIKCRVLFVEYLLMIFTYNYKTRFIHTYELLQHLNSYKYEHFSEHRFRSLIVGPVRDEGVLIVSSSAGYKLPCSSKDIYNFFNYYNQQIQPMLNRLNQCHKALGLATGGELNVLEEAGYTNLKKLLA
ncbi:uncharacterized protein DUF3800 [Pontibacter ummariensis]|uniref:DUF3800 domain-containing protein n=1 Tax=Pontibacter ummariensis TaxID=1610492 RepID=A0A239KUT6_9BACT|nr:DUF3800 domain-containing protein [Pontibacter ummariensis]PRY05021.1 uncharacterized protein DUF3800 [Pontibacter ummariensis]SNT21259.1 Protein of unknown function [Pontibacter ummariensis]